MGVDNRDLRQLTTNFESWYQADPASLPSYRIRSNLLLAMPCRKALLGSHKRPNKSVCTATPSGSGPDTVDEMEILRYNRTTFCVY